ncbi:hypothetical protein CO278_004690 [Escherichia coli]|nr:hypothetical protein [Escherichia coli]EFG8290115.1 hypothetical protein [Escherichia coli]
MSRKQLALFEPTLVVQALKEAVKKLNPQAQWRNPVMFIVWIGSLLTTCISIAMASGAMPGNALFSVAISGWLWVTVLFANFAEALAEGRIAAEGALPYPPGVLCVVPGEIWGGAVLRYFSALEEGINLLPGFAPELQGVYIEEHDGRKQVWCYVIKPRDAQSTLLKGEKL